MQIEVEQRGSNTHVRWVSNSHKTRAILDEDEKGELVTKLLATYTDGNLPGDHPFHELSPEEFVDAFESGDFVDGDE